MTILGTLDSREIYFLIACGATFALAGLYLMVRPPRGGSATRIELLGMKVSAASGGLIVFLIGASFVAVPILAPAASALTATAPAASASARPSISDEMRHAMTDTRPGPSTVASAGGEFITLRRADAVEVEENDDQFTANHIEVGGAMSGSVAYGDPDWIAFKVDLSGGQRIAIRLRSREKQGACWIELFDAREEKLNWWWFADASAARNVSTEIGRNGHFMLMLNAKEGAVCGYDLFVDYA